ncbi:MAG: nucleoside hydrolase [Hyphomonas sp.]
MLTYGPHSLIIDCDPGVDDAVMLMMALLSPQLDVRAITAVAGNVPLSLTSRNARILCQLMDRQDVPVFAGCPGPMLRAPVTAEDFHGDSGIAGLDPFEPDRPLEPVHAVTHLIDTLRAAEPRSHTVVVTGPMTNIAAALVLDPSIAEGVARLVLMAGADSEGGNITPTAEFNVFADPHAAAIVFNSGIPATVMSLDVTHTVRAELPRVDRLTQLKSEKASIMVRLLEAGNELEGRWKAGQKTPMHDPSTVAWLLAPHLFETRASTVSVVTEEGDHFGQTRPDFSAGGPHDWVTAADADGFFQLIEDLLEGT